MLYTIDIFILWTENMSRNGRNVATTLRIQEKTIGIAPQSNFVQ